MPAASSKITRRLRGSALIISSILPWPTNEYESRPIPVSRKSSVISFSRQGRRLIKYSLSWLRNTRRVIMTSIASKGKRLDELSKTTVTSANPMLLRLAVPPKIMSSMRLPRRTRGDCSPKTHFTASAILLLPLPLGPTMAVRPSPSSISVLSANDLKPYTSTRLIFITHIL